MSDPRAITDPSVADGHIKVFTQLQRHKNVVVKSALYLIKNVPACRHAVLEFFNTIYEPATVLNRKPTNQEGMHEFNHLLMIKKNNSIFRCEQNK